MSDYRSKISELRSRVSDIGAQLASLADRRKSYALAAAENDKTALKEIADVDFAADSLRKQAATLDAAVETAEALQRQQQAEAEQQERREREIEAHQHAQAVIALNEEIDLALTQLREVFERRQDQLGKLAATGIVDSAVVMRLSNKAGPTRAACFAGLHRHIDLMTVSNQSMCPLGDAAPILAVIGVLPDTPPPTKAPRLKEVKVAS